jgi:hypothetical protein
MSVHRKPLISYPCLSPLSQSAISCANSQKLGFMKWDEARGGWIAYTIHLPQGWRSSVTVVDDRLIVPSKPGKGSKREAPMDQAIEKAPKEAASSPKKTSVKKTKAGKKGKSTVAPPKAKSVQNQERMQVSRLRSQARRALLLVHRRDRKRPTFLPLLRMRNHHLRLRLLHLLRKRSSLLPSFLLVLPAAQGVKVVLR